ncbi:MAG: nuclear transport factor 2 family protein, partial [Algibacter sp.]
MKTTTLLTVLAFISMTSIFAQKKSNGTIYIEHPAITVVQNMTKAYVAGDSTKVASYLTDDFKAWNGVGTNPRAKGRDKASFAGGAIGMNNALDYFSITQTPGAYPDAIEYKKDNDEDVVWVQNWEDINGVHKKTGVKINMPMHRLYVVNKD